MSTYGLHVIQDPAGTFSYVGSIPRELVTMAPATAADVMACRAEYDVHGEIVAPKFPHFATRAEAVAFAAARGFQVHDNSTSDA
jgi:hypothetical protein